MSEFGQVVLVGLSDLLDDPVHSDILLSGVQSMSWRTGWQHIHRITFYALIMFIGFVVTWLVLLAMVRSGDDNQPTLVTEVEVHNLEARWGLDLLAVPAVAAAMVVLRRNRREIVDVAIALGIALVIAIGLAFFPSAVMGGHIRQPFSGLHFYTGSYIGDALAYTAAVVVTLLIVNRLAARMTTMNDDPRMTP